MFLLIIIINMNTSTLNKQRGYRSQALRLSGCLEYKFQSFDQIQTGKIIRGGVGRSLINYKFAIKGDGSMQLRT
jgi:hypothetical protein